METKELKPLRLLEEYPLEKVMSSVTGRYNYTRKAKYLCFCGKEFVTRVNGVSSKRTKSCGCYRRIKQKQLHTTHAGSSSRIFRTWHGMKDRCKNKKEKSYKWYGLLGIKVCKSWEKFTTFRTWVYKNGYTDSLTIDRIDPKKDYTPLNCRWVDRKIQALNRKHRPNKYDLPGIYKTKSISSPWGSVIMDSGHVEYLGSFKTKEEASLTYLIVREHINNEEYKKLNNKIKQQK